VIATEDRSFYKNGGINYSRFFLAILTAGRSGGGSTITQQLAKQLYSGKASNTLQRLLQKPIEWVIAVKLERHYTKEEIIALYLNYFDFSKYANDLFDMDFWYKDGYVFRNN